MNKQLSHRKLNAFTVVELLIVMVLSGIVLGIMYLYFSQFQDYIQQNTLQNEEYSELGMFNLIWQCDIENAEEVYAMPGKVIQLKSNNRVVEYQFKQESIVRIIDFKKERFYLRSNNFEVNSMKAYKHLVNNISFDIITDDGKLMNFLTHKTYNSKTLFHQYNNVR